MALMANGFSEETNRIVDGLRLMDDDFMTMVFDNNYPAAALLLNILLGRDDLRVKNLQVQKLEKSPLTGGRNITMDIFAVDQQGSAYNVEVQRADSGADVHRARYHSGVLDSRMLLAGEAFRSMAESYVIFLTEKDVMKRGLPIYHVERTVQETGEQFGDGNHILYVNGAYQNPEDAIGKLMHDFQCADPEKMYYPLFAEEVRHYKTDERGRVRMCRAIEEYGDRRAAEAAKLAEMKLAAAEAKIEAVETRAEREKIAAVIKSIVRYQQMGMKEAELLEAVVDIFGISSDTAVLCLKVASIS